VPLFVVAVAGIVGALAALYLADATLTIWQVRPWSNVARWRRAFFDRWVKAIPRHALQSLAFGGFYLVILLALVWPR
jgi:hypothetical protein